MKKRHYTFIGILVTAAVAGFIVGSESGTLPIQQTATNNNASSTTSSSARINVSAPSKAGETDYLITLPDGFSVHERTLKTLVIDGEYINQALETGDNPFTYRFTVSEKDPQLNLVDWINANPKAVGYVEGKLIKTATKTCDPNQGPCVDPMCRKLQVTPTGELYNCGASGTHYFLQNRFGDRVISIRFGQDSPMTAAQLLDLIAFK